MAQRLFLIVIALWALLGLGGAALADGPKLMIDPQRSAVKVSNSQDTASDGVRDLCASSVPALYPAAEAEHMRRKHEVHVPIIGLAAEDDLSRS